MTHIRCVISLIFFLVHFHVTLIQSTPITSLNEATSVKDVYGEEFYMNGKPILFGEVDQCHTMNVEVPLKEPQLRMYLPLQKSDLTLPSLATWKAHWFRYHPNNKTLSDEMLAVYFHQPTPLRGHHIGFMENTIPGVRNLGDLDQFHARLYYEVTLSPTKIFTWCVQFHFKVNGEDRATHLHTPYTFQKNVVTPLKPRVHAFQMRSFNGSPYLRRGSWFKAYASSIPFPQLQLDAGVQSFQFRLSPGEFNKPPPQPQAINSSEEDCDCTDDEATKVKEATKTNSEPLKNVSQGTKVNGPQVQQSATQNSQQGTGSVDALTVSLGSSTEDAHNEATESNQDGLLDEFLNGNTVTSGAIPMRATTSMGLGVFSRLLPLVMLISFVCVCVFLN